MVVKKGLVTLVISVYNIEQFLPKCLESVAAQTYRNLEVILIDDGSTDGTGVVCDAFAAGDSRVRVIHQEHRGQWVGQNRGLVESQGEFITFPDGDDYFHKDYVRLMYEAITSGGEKEYQLAICDFRKVEDYEADTVSDSQPALEELEQSDLLDKIRNCIECGSALWGANWNKLYRKTALPDPFLRNYRRCYDFDSNLRVFFQTSHAVYVRKELYYWFQRSGQLTRVADIIPIRNDSRCRIFFDNFQNLPDGVSDIRPDIMVNLYHQMILWKADSRGKAEEEISSRMIKEYQRKTGLYFLFRAPLPYRRRVRWLLILNAPGLLSFLDRFH